MAGTASYAFDPEVGGAGADGDTIVPGFDVGVENGDAGG